MQIQRANQIRAIQIQSERSQRERQHNSRNEQRVERYDKIEHKYERYNEKRESVYEMKHERTVQYQQTLYNHNYSSTSQPTYIPTTKKTPIVYEIHDSDSEEDDNQKVSKKRKFSDPNHQTENLQKKSKFTIHSKKKDYDHY